MFSPLQQFGQQFDRTQHVNELLVAQPLCRATNPDRSLLEVGVRLQDGTLTSLRISLPPAFPADRPALSITSPVRHPWVDSIGRLSFPLLDRWGGPNVRLAAVVADAFKGLGGQPALAPTKAGGGGGSSSSQQQGAQPGAAGQQQAGPVAGGSSGRLSAAGSGPAMAGAGSGGGNGRGGLPAAPPIPTSFPEVQQMSDEQLSQALSDEATYKQLVEQLAASLNLRQASPAPCALERLREQSRELAAANLARGEEQADIRNQQAIIRSSEYAPAKAAFDEKWGRQQGVLSKLSPEVLMRRLQDAVREAEGEGELVLQQLGAGELGVEAFVERYTKAQAKYHQRDLKLQAAQQTLQH